MESTDSCSSEEIHDNNNPYAIYFETYLRIFKSALTPKTTIDEALDQPVEKLDLIDLAKIYRQLPEGKCKSAEDLLAWAKENRLKPPPVKDLLKTLHATEEHHVPWKEDEVFFFLIRYLTDIDEICFIKLPGHRRKSKYAMDYLIDTSAAPREFFAEVKSEPPDASLN